MGALVGRGSVRAGDCTLSLSRTEPRPTVTGTHIQSGKIRKRGRTKDWRHLASGGVKVSLSGRGIEFQELQPRCL